MCITYTSALTMGNSSRRLRQSLTSNYEVVHYNLKWIAQIHELTMDNLFTYKEPMTCIFYATPNAPKSYTM